MDFAWWIYWIISLNCSLFEWSCVLCLMLGTVVGELELLSCIVDFVQSIALAQRRASRTNPRSNCSSFILFYTQQGNMSFKVIIFHWKKLSEYKVMASRRSELRCLIQASIISSLITGVASILPSHTHSCSSLIGSTAMEIVRTSMFVLSMRFVGQSQNRLWFEDWGIFLLSLLQMVKRKRKTKGRRNKIYCAFSDSEKSYNPEP